MYLSEQPLGITSSSNSDDATIDELEEIEENRIEDNSGDTTLRDTLGDYVTTAEDTERTEDDYVLLVERNDDDDINENEFVIPTDFIPTTNAGELALEVDEKVRYGFKFAGSNILNNAGSCLTRHSYDMKRSRYVNHFLQKLCSVNDCQCIPLLYPEGLLFLQYTGRQQMIDIQLQV